MNNIYQQLKIKNKTNLIKLPYLDAVFGHKAK